VWSPAFSDKALRGYETRIATYNDALFRQLSETDGKPVNVSKWFNYYSFDVMGNLAFGEDFGMLQNGEEHWAVGLLNDAMQIQALKLPTWIFRMLVAVPGLTANYWKFIGYCDEQLEKRMSKEPKVPDLMATLLPRSQPLSPSSFAAQDLLTLQADSRTIIVAGSDTTAASLTYIFYELAKHPEHAVKVREELAGLLGPSGNIEYRLIQSADHLNAVITETLRLHPVVPTIIQRKTPAEGIQVGDTYIPGGINVSCPQYVLGRSEAIYKQASEFIPERWYSKPEMVLEKSAYAPFSTGKSLQKSQEWFGILNTDRYIWLYWASAGVDAASHCCG
jgi:tryprostatin B 6-hydroxylase